MCETVCHNQAIEMMSHVVTLKGVSIIFHVCLCLKTHNISYWKETNILSESNSQLKMHSLYIAFLKILWMTMKHSLNLEGLLEYDVLMLCMINVFGGVDEQWSGQ